MRDSTVRDLTQLSKSDGIVGFQFGDQRLATTVHRAFESGKHIPISLIECDLHG